MSATASIHPVSQDQLNDALIRLNLLRNREYPDPVVSELLEGALEALFAVSRHLIVYGTLAPGGPNHRLLDPLRGEWREGWVTGELLERGWSAAMGYPALKWCPSGEQVRAHLFVSDDLPAHWKRLDDFEGLEYQRILAPFWDAEGTVVVGNLYAMECDLSP